MSCSTLAHPNITGASHIAFGNADDEVATAGVEEALLPLPQLLLYINTITTTTTTSSSAKLFPGLARHELTLQTLILGEIALAAVKDHATARLPLNCYGFCLL